MSETHDPVPGPVASSTDFTRIELHGLDDPLEVWLRPETVQVWFASSMVGTFVRAELGRWLRNPAGRLHADEVGSAVTFAAQERPGGPAVLVSIGADAAHEIPGTRLRQLQARV